MLCLVAQSCLILRDPMDCSPSGSSVRGDSPGKNPGVSDNGWNLFIFNENYKHTQSKNSISFKQNKKKIHPHNQTAIHQ